MNESKGRIANIDEIRDRIEIAEVIGNFVDLKQKGVSLVACCPFHNEKSPSFHVDERKGFYHCFGCGAGGDAIKFVQQHEKKDFYETIQWLAEFYKIELKYDSGSKVTEEEKNELSEMYSITKYAAQKYFDNLLDSYWDSPQVDYVLNQRDLTESSVIQFQIGWAPDEWRFITPALIEKGLFVTAQKIGLVNRKKDTNYDFFRSRMMFPIHDLRGQVIGFGGRYLGPEKDLAKYQNSPQSKLYNKSTVLYGLYQAYKSIRTRKCAILVEGYMDVVSFHQSGCENTISSCGTALTEDQAKLIKKYTDHVIVIRDGDPAGQKAAMKDIDILLAVDLKVEILELTGGNDPDIIAKEYYANDELWDFVKTNVQSAITYKCSKLIVAAGDDPDALAVATSDIADMLSKIPNEFKRDGFIEIISKRFKIKKASLSKAVKDIIQETEEIQYLDENDFALPSWVDKESYVNHGFDERIDAFHTGYYFGYSKNLTKLTNFVIKPLFHIYSKENNKRMIEVTNGFVTKVLEMPSKSMINLEPFLTTLFEEGFFYADGGFNRTHLLKIVRKVGDKFPLCYELRSLGWQPEGFWAYSNYAFNGELKPFDDMGIVDIHDQKFLSLSVSKVQADVRSEEDIYENDKYLTYKTPSINFQTWCELMVKVYGENGWMGIAFAITTIYRDLIFRIAKIPHLYAYGAVQAGKSQFGDSISNLFFNMMPPFNLNQGTDFAFFSRMERFKNCPNALNEFDENAIKDEWFRAIKSAYDGEGREKGHGGKAGKTKTQKITCTLVLMGQYLSTKDDSSVLSRCIPLAFKENNNRSEDQIANFRKLKELEEQGISGVLVELLQLRDEVKKYYPENFSKIKRELMDQLMSEGKSVKSRILENYVIPLVTIKIIGKSIKLPFTYDQFYAYVKDSMLKVNNLISESNSLSEFWRTVEYLLDRGEINEGNEFKIETQKSIKISVDRESDQEKQFEEPKKLLYIRLGVIHTLFMDIFKKKYGKNAPNLETIKLYLKDQSYWVGVNNGSNFTMKFGKKSSTSSIVLDYDKIGVNLERLPDDQIDDRTQVTIEGKIHGDHEVIGNVIKFTVYTIQSSGFPINTETIFYTCYLHNTDQREIFKAYTLVKVTGLLSEKVSKERVYRKIDVLNVDIVLEEGDNILPEINDSHPEVVQADIFNN